MRGGIFLKKVWYLENSVTTKRPVAKLFLYEANEDLVARLDLSGLGLMDFLGEDIQKKQWSIGFITKEKEFIDEISCKTHKDFWERALKANGIIDLSIAKKLKQKQKTLELIVCIENQIYASNYEICSVYEKIHKKTVESHKKEIDHEQEIPVQDKTGQKKEIYVQEEKNCVEEPYDTEDLPEETEPKEGLRKVIELGILEEEMLFRRFIHNSFLLHGYYNYGHLVLDERNGLSRLGVPGNYYEREQMVANMFGFPDFEPAREEKIQNGTFGYFFTKG